MQEISARLTALLKQFAQKNNAVPTQADFDELKILHARSKGSFPREFNDLMAEIHFGINSSNLSFCQRLLRILQVLDSLPIELRDVPSSEAVASTDLIPLFELKKHDKERIFELCTTMRKIVFSTSDFDQPHRMRLLNRIAAIEAETHKPKGMFDVMRGGINDLGETLGKFGKDIKPLTDRMAEVVKIARSGTKEYDQLPAPDEVKQLPAPNSDENGPQ